MSEPSESPASAGTPFPLRELPYWFRVILGPQRAYFRLAIVYGVAISLLTLAVPLSVQLLIDTVANTALVQPLVVLALVLFGLLLVSGVLSALRTHLMELFGRRIYAHLMAQFSLHAVHARAPFFEERKRDVLFHRYFDIMTLQRNIPELLIGAFAVLFQTVIGFVVVSFYHPLFLAFNLILLILLWLIWRIWGPPAVRTGVDLSEAKYEGAGWLDHLGTARAMYRADHHVARALQRSEALTAHYIEAEKRHFRVPVAETLALLLFYAGASALLLGVGGWLVIESQLSLGQLVAAELIMSAIFVGLSQFDQYLRRFYYVCMAVAEISNLYRIPLERGRGRDLDGLQAPELRFVGVRVATRRREARLELAIPPGARVRARAEDAVLERLFTAVLTGNRAPDQGYVTLGGIDLAECDVRALRRQLRVENRSTIMDCTIAEYLQLAGVEDSSRGEMFEALRRVGMDEVIRELADGLDTRLSPLGLPLSPEELLRTELAAALMAAPRVLILGSVFDALPEDVWPAVHEALAQQPELTFVRFTRREDPAGLDRSLNLAWETGTREASDD